MFKKTLALFLILWLFVWQPLAYCSTSEQSNADNLKMTAYPVITNAWSVTATDTAVTTKTATKAADSTKTWVLTAFSGGGSINGTVVINVNSVEKGRMYFPANGSTGQSFNTPIIAYINEPITCVVTLDSSGNCAANMVGYSR